MSTVQKDDDGTNWKYRLELATAAVTLAAALFGLAAVIEHVL